MGVLCKTGGCSLIAMFSISGNIERGDVEVLLEVPPERMMVYRLSRD